MHLQQQPSNQPMPHTSESKLRLSRAFSHKVANLLDSKKFKRFLDIKYEATDNIVKKVKKLNAHLKHHPELRNRIKGFNKKSGDVELKEAEHEVPDTPPGLFTTDTLIGIIPFLTYPALGRLAQTCRWMSGNITQEQADKAVKRGQEIVRKITMLTEPSGRQMIRFFSLNEEPIEFGRVLDGSHIFIIRFRNRTFIGTHPHLAYSMGLGEFYNIVVESLQAGSDVGDMGAWFELVCAYDSTRGSNDCLHMRIMLRSSKINWRLVGSSTVQTFDVGFHEFIA